MRPAQLCMVIAMMSSYLGHIIPFSIVFGPGGRFMNLSIGGCHTYMILDEKQARVHCPIVARTRCGNIDYSSASILAFGAPSANEVVAYPTIDSESSGVSCASLGLWVLASHILWRPFARAE
ncbi:hypothetical protein EJ03DRAFT_80573 [Teratosphaeria nubilosa]|uniref:Uncharacterized protein n=1 Tax=Teratosphaeria nubilosa TaxID=161662 RepID=A0A6G1LB22_9PEZI|nr:hypothetical protein EJ03DRAFT_80573 [Teratosphaeria nubilosa]